MAKRDRGTVGIWVAVACLHATGWWAASRWYSPQTLRPPEVQWVQALAIEPAQSPRPSASTAAPTRQTLSPPPLVPARPPRPEVSSERTPTPSPPEPLASPDMRAETRATDGRWSDAKGPAATSGSVPAMGRPVADDWVPPSQSASYLNNPPPPYPPMSKRLGEQGRVVVRVYIDEQGVPKEALLEVKSGYSRLDQAALQAVMSWRYVPAKRAGVPLAMWFNVPVTFDLKSNKE